MSEPNDTGQGNQAFVAPSSNLWSDFVWPDWVPARERELIEQFWCGSMNRGPAEWLENGRADYNQVIPSDSSLTPPANGAFIRAWTGIGDARRVVSGRRLHRWNNINVVVTDGGRWSSGRIGDVFSVHGLVDVDSVRKVRETMDVEHASLVARFTALAAARVVLDEIGCEIGCDVPRHVSLPSRGVEWRGIEDEVRVTSTTPSSASELVTTAKDALAWCSASTLVLVDPGALTRLVRRAVAEGARLGLERPFASEDGMEEWLQDGKWLDKIANGEVDV